MNYAGTFEFSQFGTMQADPTAGVDAIGGSSQPGHAPSIVVQDANLLFSGDYKRSGVDLVLSKDGHDYVVSDYFKGSLRAALSSPDGAQLSGDLVTALVGEIQVAQLGGGANAAAQVIGSVTKLTGSATAIRNGVSVMLNVGDSVQKGDVVQAGADSSLGLTFIDGTVFGLSANARMVLNEMVYDPQGSANSSLLSLVQGTITFVAGETAKNGNMRVDTPVATMGIRGTAVLVEIGFEVPGQGGAPPVKFQVLVEPNGVTGSYVLYSKTSGQVVGTVNTAGQVTSVFGNGDTSTGQADPLTPLAQAIIQQTLQLYFPNYVPNANPRSNGSGGSTPSDPIPNQIDKLPNLRIDQPNVVPINLPGNGSDAPTTIIVTVTPRNTAPTIEVSPVVVTLPVDKTSFKLADQVTITDPDAANPAFNDAAVPYVAGTGRVTSATGPAHGPSGAALASLVAVDPQTGAVSYDAATFKFLAAGESAIFTIAFDSRSGPDTVHETVTLTVNGINDAPVVESAHVTVAEGGTVVLSAANIVVNDPDGGNFTFKVSNVTHGTFQVSSDGTHWTDATAFTSAELNAGHVRFVHDGSEAAPSFSIQADDGSTVDHLSNVATGTVAFTNVNDAPVITFASLMITQGGTVIVQLSDVGISDPDSSSFTYYATATHGSFEILVGQTWVTLTGDTPVTSADIAAGHVRFHHDGSAYAPDVTVTVSDGTDSSAPFEAHVDFSLTSTINHLVSTAGTSIDVSVYGATDGFVLPGAGNVTTPGTPEDRIVLGYDLGSHHIVLNGAPMMGDKDFSAISDTLTHNADGSNSVSTVLGAGNGVTLTQTITLGADANFFTTTIDIFNGGTTALDNVRFMRNIDPDQDVDQHGNYNTYNDVIHNPTGADDVAIVSAKGGTSHAEVALIGLSGDWRASSYGFTNKNPYVSAAYDAPSDPNGQLADQAISLTYNVGTIGAGQHATFTYITTNNVATEGSNALFGTEGADTINGLGGNDLLIGLGGADNFVFTANSGHDTIFDFQKNLDHIDLSASVNTCDVAAWMAAHVVASGADTLITLDSSNTILLHNVAHTSLSASDFIVHV